MKKVLLCDVDSTIINIALAKISAYHKQCGDDVTLLRGTKPVTVLDDWGDHYDDVYISCVFKSNKEAVDTLAKQFPHSNVHVGGSGYDLVTVLPDEIENIMPDNTIYHDIFPETKYTSYGFTSRGCIRKCSFCIVPIKEGRIHPVGDLYTVWNKDAGHTKVVFYDNNILALPEHFEKIADQIKNESLACDFNQGMDIRLINDDNAAIIKSLKLDPYPRFAFDDIKSESAVRRGIEILKNAGVNVSMFYVLSGFNSTFEDDLKRVNILRDLGQKAFIMMYDKELLKQPRYDHLMNWTNARMHYFTQTYEEYFDARETGKYREMLKAKTHDRRIANKDGKKLEKYL